MKKMPLPDWTMWTHCLRLTVNEAAALIMNVCPNAVKKIEEEVFPSTSNELFYLEAAGNGFDFDDAQKYKDRLHVLKRRYGNCIPTSELLSFVAQTDWCPPPEFMALGLSPTKSEPEPSSISALRPFVLPKIESESSSEEALSSLFDSVPYTVLEKMFVVREGQWKKWADHANANGLKKARTGRGRYNPYLAGMWFLQKGIPQWDLARCNRVLANNLPARSHHYKHLLVPELT